MPAALLSAALVAAVLAAPNADLKKAEEQFAQFKYAEARASLAKARAAKGLERPTLLRILELQGIAAGQLRQAAQAEAAFRELLVLDPGHKLEQEYAPRVMTPFMEAGGFATEKGALELRAGPAVSTADSVESVAVEVAKDPLSMARGVRFHVQGPGGAWRTVDAALKDGKATLGTRAPEVRWWAELLGDNEAQLALVGSEAAPQVDRPPAPVAAALPPPVKPPPVDVPAVTSRSSPLRPVSFAVLGGALVAGGLGGFFGWRSSDAFGQLNRALSASTGTVTGLTERQAYELNASGKQNATIANALFISAGALAVGGVVLWWLGAPVELAPAPGGVMVSGSFP